MYDILNGLGYKVFLDQYVLTAAAPLAISLGEAWTRARALFSFGRVSRRTLCPVSIRLMGSVILVDR